MKRRSSRAVCWAVVLWLARSQIPMTQLDDSQISIFIWYFILPHNVLIWHLPDFYHSIVNS